MPELEIAGRFDISLSKTFSYEPESLSKSTRESMEMKKHI